MVSSRALLLSAVVLAAGTVSAGQHDPNTIKTCSGWLPATEIDTCETLADFVGVSVDVFVTWNPSLNADCKAVKNGWDYCASVSNVAEQAPSTPITTTMLITTTKPPVVTPPPPPPPAAEPTEPTLTPSKFPPGKGTIQCAGPPPKKNPVAGAIQNYTNLQAAIKKACIDLLGTKAKWLEKGDPYTVDTPVTNHQTRFQLQILKGGFNVPVDTCVNLLSSISKKAECKVDLDKKSMTYGGCAFTPDYNLEACFLPWISPQ